MLDHGGGNPRHSSHRGRRGSLAETARIGLGQISNAKEMNHRQRARRERVPDAPGTQPMAPGCRPCCAEARSLSQTVPARARVCHHRPCRARTKPSRRDSRLRRRQMDILHCSHSRSDPRRLGYLPAFPPSTVHARTKLGTKPPAPSLAGRAHRLGKV